MRRSRIDWLSAETRRILAGETTDRRGLILAAQELAWEPDVQNGNVAADFLVVLLKPSASASGISTGDSIGPSDELTRICREVARHLSPPGRTCPKCGDDQGGYSGIGSLDPSEVLPCLAHLLAEPPPTGPRPLRQSSFLVRASGGRGCGQ